MTDRVPWTHWGAASPSGVSFDRTPSGPIRAPEGRYRVCAYHIDFDERPVCYVDVDTEARARAVAENLHDDSGGYNVDYACVFDAKGKQLVGPPW